MLPDLSGQEVCQRIRSSSQDSYAYVIVLTAQTGKENLVKALALGADDYLTKPFHRGELLARVGVGARITGLHRQVEAKNKQLEELALTDALTGLPNRRAIEDWAASQLSNAARHGFPFWVALADLDHFKQVNDTFGHDAGDAVLKRFSKILKSSLRRGDLCGRLGGEEFLLVLTHTDKENALKVIDRIRLELSSTPVTFGGCTVGVTASFGLAGFEGSQRRLRLARGSPRPGGGVLFAPSCRRRQSDRPATARTIPAQGAARLYRRSDRRHESGDRACAGTQPLARPLDFAGGVPPISFGPRANAGRIEFAGLAG